MVKLVDDMNYSDKTIDRILVCITAQGNSKRLINSGAQIADDTNGELHILHVQAGDSIFNNDNTPKLLEDLFNFDSEKGGMVHCYCDKNVSKCIGQFTKEKGITKIVFGQPPTDNKLEKEIILNKLKQMLKFVPKGVELIIIPRQEGTANICIERN